ncbi:capsular polysaccharide biosynthesis protein [Cupriavidus metallidurans]|uniref:capsular polysaccharide biosynthesis protein n=1 Tax=Cupriavidus TaxID=106589 RepID=UPI0025799C8A|nr:MULTISPECIES: capsular polysaccharide biosynthesis protein [unclassified Cupriavidus]GMG92811.1 capsule polysaccharide modification protein LipA [Cupriavidus sp. TKC]
MVFAVVTPGLWRTPGLRRFFHEGVAFRPRQHVDAVLGWGDKPSSIKARAWAARRHLPFLSVEDGFLRSIHPGRSRQGLLSLVVDDLGIYYDARRPSRLEQYIAQGDASAAERDAGARAMQLVLQHRLTKYNHMGELHLPASTPGKPRVLVVDQTEGDLSLLRGGASADTFARMIAAALAEHPDAEIWIKTHPDVLSGRRRGHYERWQLDSRVRLLAQECCPLSLLAQMDHVYVATSQMGFEALMLGKPVTCFGLPWYAGWGLTHDVHPEAARLALRRGRQRNVVDLFVAAYIQYTRYIHPVTGQSASIFDVIDWLARNKAIGQEGKAPTYCVGMSLWKRATVMPFLSASTIRSLRHLSPDKLNRLPQDTTIAIWGDRHAGLIARARARGLTVLQMEDGFVRSAGLGSDLHAPLSLAVDPDGVHYDPKSASKLEQLLSTRTVNPDDAGRGRRLRETLVRNGIDKYNLGHSTIPVLPAQALGKRIILVIGQVEDDASVRNGSTLVKGNDALLAATRRANPDAWVIYKSHPDVEAGNRIGSLKPASEILADQIITEASLGACLVLADEVHVMTSLSGFEALLRGKAVHCYGAPFYAGWGLTTDHFPLPRRQRRLTLDALVFVALCLYPRYRLPGVEGFCSVEDVVDWLARRKRARLGATSESWLVRQGRKAGHLARSVLQHGRYV